jgi:GTP:adenosylcobinamide-phosphate guanylyltransferase
LKAVIMAGGRAQRFKTPVEKATLIVRGRTLLERSAAALSVKGIDEIKVAGTRRTTETHRLARKLGLELLETEGKGYHEDVLEMLRTLGSFVSLNVDVPFVAKKDIRELMASIGDRSIASVAPAELAMGKPSPDSVMVDPKGREMIWLGFNYVTKRPDTDLLVFEDPILTININNEEDLAFAEMMARRKKI